jgi:hypothetical protein
VEAVAVAAISALGAIAVALINARATRQRDSGTGRSPDGTADEPGAGTRPGRLGLAWRRLWELFGRLPPLGRRRTAWVAALVGFLFGGFGIALYFRRQADLLVGLVFLIPLFLATRGEGDEATFGWWYWPFATLAATYCVLRVESANRQLEPS